jgi:hypothetical protein
MVTEEDIEKLQQELKETEQEKISEERKLKLDV